MKKGRWSKTAKLRVPCKICGKEKPPKARVYCSAECRKHSTQTPEKEEYRRQYYARQKKLGWPDRKRWLQNNPQSKLLVYARHNAKTRGLPCDLSREDIIVPDICPVLGIPLDLTAGPKKETSPSVDRIDNTKGYIKGNVVIISSRANTLKNNASLKEIQQLAEFYRKFM